MKRKLSNIEKSQKKIEKNQPCGSTSQQHGAGARPLERKLKFLTKTYRPVEIYKLIHEIKNASPDRAKNIIRNGEQSMRSC